MKDMFVTFASRGRHCSTAFLHVSAINSKALMRLFQQQILNLERCYKKWLIFYINSTVAVFSSTPATHTKVSEVTWESHPFCHIWLSDAVNRFRGQHPDNENKAVALGGPIWLTAVGQMCLYSQWNALFHFSRASFKCTLRPQKVFWSSNIMLVNWVVID